jgi:hypothetical protein
MEQRGRLNRMRSTDESKSIKVFVEPQQQHADLRRILGPLHHHWSPAAAGRRRCVKQIVASSEPRRHADSRHTRMYAIHCAHSVVDETRENTRKLIAHVRCGCSAGRRCVVCGCWLSGAPWPGRGETLCHPSGSRHHWTWRAKTFWSGHCWTIPTTKRCLVHRQQRWLPLLPHCCGMQP